MLYPFESGTEEVCLETCQVEDYGVKAVHAEEAWKRTRGEGITVGILDTGVDASHPDLAPNVRRTSGFGAGHGTHVAGIVGACDNGFGVVGVAPACSLRSYPCIPGDPLGVAAAIALAASEGCDVLNLSLGGYEDCPELEAACEAAWRAGVVICAAAGNDSARVSFPASYPCVIAVSAVDAEGKRAPFAPVVSNHVALPGVSLLSTWPGGQYARLSGTSQACPLLTGIVALMLALYRPTRDLANATVQAQLARIDARADDFHFVPHLEML